MSIDRVADRVRKGGHNIPESVIRRRYTAGIQNLFRVYRPILDSWRLFDNSLQMPYLIAKESSLNLVVLKLNYLKDVLKWQQNPLTNLCGNQPKCRIGCPH